MMASEKQVAAAKRNVKKAQRAATRKRTIAHLPAKTRRDLVAEAQKGRRRGGQAGHGLEDRNREQLYEVARGLEIRGRSKMGKSELIRAIRAARGK
jgi:Rho termination factor, N-terminal domain